MPFQIGTTGKGIHDVDGRSLIQPPLLLTRFGGTQDVELDEPFDVLPSYKPELAAFAVELPLLHLLANPDLQFGLLRYAAYLLRDPLGLQEDQRWESVERPEMLVSHSQ